MDLFDFEEMEWPFAERRSFYGDHPYVRAFEKKPLFPISGLIKGAARMLIAPLDTPPPQTIADIIAADTTVWTDIGGVKHIEIVN